MKPSTRTIKRVSLILAVLLITTALALTSNRFEELTPTAHAAVERTWNGSNGNWSTPSNWSGGVAPGQNDTVRITGGRVKIDASEEVTVLSLELMGTGQIEGDGTLIITRDMTWTGGNMGEGKSGSGTTVIASGATLSIGGDPKNTSRSESNYCDTGRSSIRDESR